MAEIRLELNLARASGVLAGIVAALAQSGLELRSQRLARASEGRGGTLDIVVDGAPPEPGDLVALMESARGVDRLMRIEIDGEAVLAEGRVLEDIMDADSLAALAAGPAPEIEEPRPEFDSDTWDGLDDTAERLEPSPPVVPAEVSESTDHAGSTSPTEVAETVVPSQASEPAEPDEPPEPVPPEPSGDRPKAARADSEPAPDIEPAEATDPNRVEAALRRRRRRRR